jgi:threonylcarbamoyladenosine tRNA methylthiotransferase MtaB
VRNSLPSLRVERRQRRFYLETLGCKLNQADTDAVAAALAARGMVPAGRPEEADLLVLNTCTVTAGADAAARQTLRRLARAAPGSPLIAMGCLARRAPEMLERLAGTSVRVSPGSDPAPILAAAEAAFGADLAAPALPVRAVPAARTRTRAWLKIQDGCDLACSYCIIPAVRGRSRSIPPAAIEAALRRLIEAGFAEIVLTGVNTGEYGADLSPSTSLAALLRRLVRLPGLGRVRLNSLEPRSITPEMIDLMAGGERLAPHLQIPLQSGSDAVLARMRRNYRRPAYERLLDRLAARVPGIGLGADVICGFPGETDHDHGQTMALVRDSPLSYLHVFSYSQRPGTAAARMGDAVLAPVVRERSAELRALALRKGESFRRGFVGRVLDAVILRRGRDGEGRALTGNFIEVRVSDGVHGAGGLVPIRILQASGQTVLGVPAT